MFTALGTWAHVAAKNFDGTGKSNSPDITSDLVDGRDSVLVLSFSEPISAFEKMTRESASPSPAHMSW